MLSVDAVGSVHSSSRASSISQLDNDVLRPTGGDSSSVDPSLNDLMRGFKESCERLERQLEMFASSVRQLGSSLGLYTGCREFHKQLSSIRRLLEGETEIALLVNKIPSRNSYTANPPETIYYPDDSNTWVHEDLWRLVDAIGIFSTAWEDFPEFADRKFLAVLEQHLLVWLNILGCYEYSTEFHRCLRELLIDTVLELDRVSQRLEDFIVTGIREISYAQRHSAQVLLNTATIATFLSAVTVTTIQYSFTDTTSHLSIAVNTCWFSSLVLSVAAAINSLLAMTWRQAMYSTPQRRVPWWVRIWFNKTPIALLSSSILSFSGGLLCFVFLTQHHFTKIVVSALASIIALGLGAITVWFAWERWDFTRLRRKIWLQETHEKIESSHWIFLVEYIFGNIWRPRTASLPTLSSPLITSSKSQITEPRGSAMSLGQSTIESNVAENKWDILKAYVRSRRQQGPPRNVTRSSTLNGPRVPYSDKIFRNFIPKRKITILRVEIDDPIRHIQFSPGGNWLAACTQSICYIFKIATPEVYVHQTLKHPFGRIRQVEWSSDEQHLLMRVSGGVEVWEIIKDKLGNCQKEWIRRVKKVQWVNNKALLVLREEEIIQFSISSDGRLIQDRTIAFGTALYTFAVVPSHSILVVGAHIPRTHQRIRLPTQMIRSVATHNLVEAQSSHSFPLLRDVRWISVSSDGAHALFGYINQPPELWSFGDDGHRMSLIHRFIAGKDRYSGPPHFVGAGDEFVACATLGGSTQIWKRDGNELVCSIPSHDRDPGAAVPVMSWNRQAAMFALGETEVNLWVPNSRT